MKTPPFLLIGCPVIIVAAGLTYALTRPPHEALPQAALMDSAEETPADASGPAPAGGDANRPMDGAARHGGGGGGGGMRQAFAQLGLTDEQKDQIAKIRQTVTDREQRRAAIMKVLTPEQQAKLRQARGARGHRDGPPPASGASAATNAAPANGA